MRILLYSFEYPPLGGGVGRSLEALLHQFKDYNDLTIDVVTSSIDGKYQEQQFSSRITLYFLPGPNRKKSLHGQKPIHMLYFTFISWLFTWKLLFSNQYDLTHFYGFPGGVVSWLFSWRTPYVLSLRGVEVPGYNPQFKTWYRWYRPLARFIWRRALGITVNSTNLKHLATKTLDRNYTVIPNGVNTAIFTPVSDSKKYSHFTITAGATILSKIKNLETLIRAFATFHSRYPDSRLLLIGSGPEEKPFKDLVNNLNLTKAVTFTGRKSHTWLKTNLPLSHVVCLPSLNEGMSNALLEAMACGLPILISREAGAAELIDGNGFVVDSLDTKAIAKYLEILYTDHSLRKSMSKKSRERAEYFSHKNTATQYYQWYRQFLYT